MKIKYTFATETVEIDVPEEWGNIVVDFDREEYNNNHTETRRHRHEDMRRFISHENVESHILAAERHAELEAAIAKLEPRQQYLVREIYYKKRKASDIAAEEGISKSAVSHALDRALQKMKKYLD